MSSYANPFGVQTQYHPPPLLPPPLSPIPIISPSIIPPTAIPINLTKKMTLQVSRYNNNHGSFSTSIETPRTGQFPTLHSLQTKIQDVATTAGVKDYQLYYRYGINKSKVLLDDNSFSDIDWSDERLSFNITENKPVLKRKLPDAQNDDPQPKKKSRSKYDDNNDKKNEAEALLRTKLPEDLQNQMTHADFIHASCLMVGNPNLWTIEAVEQDLRKKKTKKKQESAPALLTNSNNESVVNVQNSVLKLYEKVMHLEEQMQKLQAKFDQQQE